jgi:hypothetical protein
MGSGMLMQPTLQIKLSKVTLTETLDTNQVETDSRIYQTLLLTLLYVEVLNRKPSEHEELQTKERAEKKLLYIIPGNVCCFKTT